MRRKRWLAALTGIVVTLLLAEGALRLAWTPPRFRSTLAIGDHAVYGWAPLPGLEGRVCTWEYEHAVRHTRQRMRGRVEFGRAPAPGTTARVLFLGDSFTYGVAAACEETFVARLDAAWPTVEVANAGCNGYGTRESLAVLDRLGPAFRPDLTVLVFFWNDLEDNLGRTAPDFRFGAGGRVERTDAAPPFDPLALLPPATARAPSRWSGSYVHELLRDGLRSLRYRYCGIKRRLIASRADADRAWETTDRLLRLAAARANEIGTRLVVVSLPDHNQVDPLARIRNITPLHFDVQKRLAAACRRAGLPLLDLLPAMAAEFARTGDPLFFFADRHLTPAGNRVVARLLEERLGADE